MNKDAIDALRAHVREEERALRTSSPRSIRLAGEFHILLAELTHSTYLTDMISQVVSRCSLILAQFGRPHSAECGIDEHLEIISALEAQDEARAVALLSAHLQSVEDRAEIEVAKEQPDAAAILKRYASADLDSSETNTH